MPTEFMLILRMHEWHYLMLTSAETADTWSVDQEAEKL